MLSTASKNILRTLIKRVLQTSEAASLEYFSTFIHFLLLKTLVLALPSEDDTAEFFQVQYKYMGQSCEGRIREVPLYLATLIRANPIQLTSDDSPHWHSTLIS